MYWDALAVGLLAAMVGIIVFTSLLAGSAIALLTSTGIHDGEASTTVDVVFISAVAVASYLAFNLATQVVGRRFAGDHFLHCLTLLGAYAALLVLAVLVDMAAGFPIEDLIPEDVFSSFGIVQYAVFASLVAGFAAVMVNPSKRGDRAPEH